jgi:MFS family permease
MKITTLNEKPYWAMFTYDATICFPTAFFFYIFIDSGANAGLIAFLYLLVMFMIMILEVPTGFIADVIGRKNTMIVSNICFALAYICVLFSPDFFFIISYFIFYAFALAFRSGSLSSWLQEFSQKTANHHAEFQKFALYSLAGRMFGSSLGFAVFFLSGSYNVSIAILVLMYLLSIVLFKMLREDHKAKPDVSNQDIINDNIDKKHKDFKNSLNYIRAFGGQFVILSLISGAIFILSLPIYLYYPVHIDLLFQGNNRLSASFVVQLSFLSILVLGYFLTAYTKKILLNKSSHLKRLSVIYGMLLGSISILMYYSYKYELLYILVILPIICSALFNVLRTTSESISTDMIKKSGYEKNMSTIISLQSALGNIVFGLYYLMLNYAISLQGYGKIILLYIYILPVAFILTILITLMLDRKSTQ